MNAIKKWLDVLKIPKNEGRVVVIFGHRRQGKSGLAWWLVEKLHKRYSTMGVVAVGLPKSKRKLAPEWVKHEDDIMKLPEKCIVLVDEAALRYSARRSQCDGNVMMSALLALSGQRQQFIIFVAHTARLLDVEQVFDSDLVIYKLPSAAHVKFERKETAEYTKQARSKLLKKSNPKKWAYVIDFHSDKVGLLQNGLPSFWSDDLSNAWAGLDVSTLLQAGKKKTNGGFIL